MNNPHYDKDIAIPCPDHRCHVKAGEPCIGTVPTQVHFGRRLRRLMNERGMTVASLAKRIKLAGETVD